MEEQKTNISASDVDQIPSFIKSLGGAKAIYSYLKSKNINVNIESIYKWKNNGIPYRYLLHIKELADHKNIGLPENIFPDNIGSINNKTDVISSIENNSKDITIKGYRTPILIVLLTFFIILLLWHYQSNMNNINERILKLEDLTLSFNTHDYDKKLDVINDFIEAQIVFKKQHSSDIKNLYSLSTTNKNKLKDLEKNIDISFSNNNKVKYSELENFNITLLNLIVLKENIKFSTPNLNNIDLINNYFSHIETPEGITSSLLNLNALSKKNIKSHKQLIEEIEPLLKDINNKNIDKKKYNKVDILTYLKNLIKISKISNNELINKKVLVSNIINNLNSYNYDYILNEFKSVNNNIKLSEWLESVNYLNNLNNSLNNIINWLVYKG